jgi:formylglycine-generating enzyme required for sulfatase activity
VRFRLESLSFHKLLYISTFQYISGSPKQPVVHGDVNGDGEITIADVNAVIDVILSGAGDSSADVNDDGEISIADVNEVINLILNPRPSDETFTIKGVSFKMVGVVGGTFTMGGTSEQGSDPDDDEYPTHQVTLSSFSIGQTEVTQALWEAVMGSNPSYVIPNNGFSENLQRPVDHVSWNDCQLFITKLNQLTGKKFRLPTEAEWEYAARGGNKGRHYKFSGSNNIGEVGWYSGNAYNVGSGNPDYGSHTVGTKKPNELGLYDMSGNVSEWCQDWWSEAYSSSAQSNPTGALTGSHRISRGGCWFHDAEACRMTKRINWHQSSAGNACGFRLALGNGPKMPLSVSHGEVTLPVGKQWTIGIFNGSGNYSLSNTSGIVTAQFSNHKLMLTATWSGSTTLFVTDNVSHDRVAIKVTVPDVVTEDYSVNGVPFSMVRVDGGTFTMGATAEQGNTNPAEDEYPTHQVTLSSFSIGQTEVTQALWVAVMGYNPSYFCSYQGYSDNPNRPVEYVTWGECQRFIATLNQMTGKQFRLPTEAEWEFAARGGNKRQSHIYAGSDNIYDVGWVWSSIPTYDEGSDNYGTQPVATKIANELGLYDMTGNACEWCSDSYDSYTSNAQTNPSDPATPSIFKNIRGGCWVNGDKYCRVSRRYTEDLWYVGSGLGLRLAMGQGQDWVPVGTCTFTDHTWEDGYTSLCIVEKLVGTNTYRIVSPLAYTYDNNYEGGIGDTTCWQFMLNANGSMSVPNGTSLNYWGYHAYYDATNYGAYCYVTKNNNTYDVYFLLEKDNNLYIGGRFVVDLYL